VLGIDKSMEGTNCHGRLNGLYTDEAVSCHKCVTIPSLSLSLSLSITSMREQKEKVNNECGFQTTFFFQIYRVIFSY